MHEQIFPVNLFTWSLYVVIIVVSFVAAKLVNFQLNRLFDQNKIIVNEKIVRVTRPRRRRKSAAALKHRGHHAPRTNASSSAAAAAAAASTRRRHHNNTTTTSSGQQATAIASTQPLTASTTHSSRRAATAATRRQQHQQQAAHTAVTTTTNEWSDRLSYVRPSLTSTLNSFGSNGNGTSEQQQQQQHQLTLRSIDSSTLLMGRLRRSQAPTTASAVIDLDAMSAATAKQQQPNNGDEENNTATAINKNNEDNDETSKTGSGGNAEIVCEVSTSVINNVETKPPTRPAREAKSVEAELAALLLSQVADAAVDAAAALGLGASSSLKAKDAENMSNRSLFKISEESLNNPNNAGSHHQLSSATRKKQQHASSLASAVANEPSIVLPAHRQSAAARPLQRAHSTITFRSLRQLVRRAARARARGRGRGRPEAMISADIRSTPTTTTTAAARTIDDTFNAQHMQTGVSECRLSINERRVNEQQQQQQQQPSIEQRGKRRWRRSECSHTHTIHKKKNN